MADKFKACSVDGCNGNAHYTAKGALGWCTVHYRRARRHGAPEAGRAFKGVPLKAVIAAMAYDGDECLYWTLARDAVGYGQYVKNGKVSYVHRDVCTKVHGPPPSRKHHAAHSCGNGHLGCVTPKHLRWATPKENAADKLKHGTLPLGERHHASRLTEDQVRQIRGLRGTATQREIGAIFGVGEDTVGSIHRGENWSWLK